MKKLFQVLIIAVIAIFVACGPNAKEKAEKNKQDSIVNADSVDKFNDFIGKSGLAPYYYRTILVMSLQIY